MEEQNKLQMSLVRKLAEVMGVVGWIPKTGTNEFHGYKYAQEADLVDAIRGELAKRHVMVFPDVQQVTRSLHETETLKWNDQLKAKAPVVRKTQLTEIAVKWTFVDGESGEERTVTVHGVGEDNMDKGFYKAFTGSEKYMLMKTFLIPTGDDPEKDSKEEAEDARSAGKEAAKQVASRKLAEKGVKPQEAQETVSQAREVQIEILPNMDWAVTGNLEDKQVAKFLVDIEAKGFHAKKDGRLWYKAAPEYLADFKKLCDKQEVKVL